MQRSDFNRAMLVLAKAFPDKEMDVDMMWVFLSDLTPKQMELAVCRIIAGQKEMFRSHNLIGMIREAALSSARPTAGQAWAEVLRQVSAVGRYGIPEFSDPAVVQAVEAVGWSSICMSEQVSIERAHFFRAYEQIAARLDGKAVVDGVLARIGSDGGIAGLLPA